MTFRRRLLEDPMRDDLEFLEHEQACHVCAGHARRTRANEIRLRALLHVTPPQQLAERIQLAASLDRSERPSRQRWFGMAAGLAMLAGALSIGWFMSPGVQPGYSLGDSVLHHIYDEAQHLHEVGPVKPSRVKALFAYYGAKLSGDLGEVNFAANCMMRKKTGIHLVLPGQRGAITVFFMPDETLTHRINVRDARFAGYVQPAQWGSLAIVGEAGEPLDGLGDRLLRSVDWPAQVSHVDNGPTLANRRI